MKNLLLLFCCIFFLSALSAQVLYGTTIYGGTNNAGTINKLVTGSNTLTSVFDFESTGGISPTFAQLVIASDGKFYGMTTNSGATGNGVIFSYDPSTGTYTNVYQFDGSKGGHPFGSLARAIDNKLYGMTSDGGINNLGVLFSFDPATNTYLKILDFDGTNGGRPSGSLVQATNGKLYGMTQEGGTNSLGVIFSYDPFKKAYAKLLNFDNANGASPYGSLMQAVDGKLYGMTYQGGSNFNGLLFSFDPFTNTYTKLKDFNPSDGSRPEGELEEAYDGKLYGMTSAGGNSNVGVIFSFDPHNSTYFKLKDFDGDDGANPYGSLVRAFDNKLYGMTSAGGFGGAGVIFSFNPADADYTKFLDFFGTNGANPYGTLTQGLDGKLYGMTNRGGPDGNSGLLFSLNPSDAVYTRLVNFGANSTGNAIAGGVIKASDNKLYGMTSDGGKYSGGVIFSFDTSNATFTKLLDFDGTNGYSPYGSLMQASDGKLYGMTNTGGIHDNGAVFSLDPATNTYTKLVDFDDDNGANPFGNLIQAHNGKLYGMTNAGGANGAGVIFSLDPVTKTYTRIFNFDVTRGAAPYGSLTEVGDKLYGTTFNGGDNSFGVLFSLDTTTNTYTKLYDFASATGISPVGKLVNATDGKLYGMTAVGGSNSGGVIFSFEPVSNTYTKLYDFDITNGGSPYGSLMQASDGKLYGMTLTDAVNNSGIAFSYDPASSTYTKLAGFNGTNGRFPYFTFFTEMGCSTQSTYYKDADGDSFGDISQSIQACSQPSGYVTNSDDCDDTRSSVHPGAAEICGNGIDDNCDGQVDEGCSLPTIKINDVSIAEGNSGSQNMTFNVTLSKASTQTVTVNYTTVNGTATAPSDFTAKTGTLTFTPGIKKRTITIKIKGDLIFENDENLSVVLSNAANAAIGDNTGTGTILNDDVSTNRAAGLSATKTADAPLVQVSPNPAVNIINVRLKGFTGNTLLQMTDVTGKTVQEVKLQADNLKHLQHQFNTADIAAGTYYIVALDEHGHKQSQKVVVIH